MKKGLIAFFSVFLFIQICGIYIVGGFDNQTIPSKSIGIGLGIIIGAFIAGIIMEAENN